MTEQVEIKIPFADLIHVVIECPDCGAEVSLNISKHSNVTTRCPGGNHSIDRKFDEAFTRIRQSYEVLKDTPFAEKMFFRIKKNY